MSSISIIQILYLIVLLVMVLMSGFIVFHIVFYSYTKSSKLTMLALFLPVVTVLLITNYILFVRIPLDKLLPVFSM